MDHNIDFTTAPDGLAEDLRLYYEDGEEPTVFLTAVLGNDLLTAIHHAGSKNLNRIFEIVNWVYNSLPTDCYGSYETVKEWIADCGLNDQEYYKPSEDGAVT